MSRRMAGILAIVVAPATFAPAAAQERRVEAVLLERTFEARPGGRLTVSFGDMDIVVREGSGPRAGLRVIALARDPEWARQVFEDMNLEVRANAGDLSLRTNEDHEHPWDWREWERRGGVSLRAEITVPRRYDLDLRTGDGDVAIGRLEGEANIRTGDGDVGIEELSGPRVEIHTGDGDVAAGRLAAREVLLRTGDGDLMVRRVAGAITASTGDGDVHLDVEAFEGISIRTGDGDVTLYVDADIAADVDIRGDELSLGQALTLVGTVREGRVQGALNGGGPRLTIRTGDGSVTVRTR